MSITDDVKEDFLASNSFFGYPGSRTAFLSFALMAVVTYVGATSLAYWRVVNRNVGIIDRTADTLQFHASETYSRMPLEAVPVKSPVQDDPVEMVFDEISVTDAPEEEKEGEEATSEDEEEGEEASREEEEASREEYDEEEDASFSGDNESTEETSPYELRYEDWELPDWAHKTSSFSQPIPPEKKVCLVHVGKTAGSTIGCYLGFQLHCDDSVTYPTGHLPNYTTNVFHNDVNDCPNDPPPAYYLFTLRHPLKRRQSSYVYDRRGTKYNASELYKKCPFYTLNDLAERGLASDGNSSAVCKERAYNAIRGYERFGYHLFHNYRHYTIATLADETRKLLVIQTEHLQEDWRSAEALLGGNATAIDFPTFNKASNKISRDSYLSKKSQALLCNALSEEIEVYKSLLRRAVNLSPEQVKTSLDELSTSCPHEVSQRSCI